MKQLNKAIDKLTEELSDEFGKMLNEAPPEKQVPFKVTAVRGNQIDLENPEKPGIKTTIDMTKGDMNIADDPKKPNAKVLNTQQKLTPGGRQLRTQIRPGNTISMNNKEGTQGTQGPY